MQEAHKSTDYRLIAIELGELLKWDTTVNEIRRIASALFPFVVETFPNDSITSTRAQCINDCVLSLAKQQMIPEERNKLLVTFCRRITPAKLQNDLNRIIEDIFGSSAIALRNAHEAFMGRAMHPQIVEHCKLLFAQGNFFHAVFEACKVYNRLVQERSQSSLDGQALMLQVWGCDRGVLKITQCQTETDKNVQEGIKFLSAGLMAAMRNPTAHEPAQSWPIDKQDCLDMLSFISFLFRRLDKAVYFQS